MLQKIPVVACDLDDLAVLAETKTLSHHLAITSGVLDPTCRETAEIEVITEDRIG
jgi:hypothetical protein